MNRTEYLTIPVVKSARILVLAKALYLRAQTVKEALSVGELVIAAIAALKEGIDQLAATLELGDEKPDRVAIDAKLDASWRGLYYLLQAFTELEHNQSAKAAKAKSLLAKLFPADSLSFIRLSFNEEWSASQARLSTIDEALAGALDELGATPFVESLRADHQAYSEMLGLEGKHEPKEEVTAYLEARALREAIQDYVFTLIPYANSASTEALVVDALAPIVELKREG